jgi:hypothetical protein
MHVRRLTAATLVILAFGPHAEAQDRPVALTAAGKAILEAKLATDGDPLDDRPGPEKPFMFPLAMCAFPGGLCGAVRRDGSVAVPPRYDWVGTFSDGRAAVRTSDLYGFVDENGHEIVPPRYRIVGDYKFGFAQVDIDGKSGLIDRNGRLVIEPRYGFVEAVAPDRFRVSETRQLVGTIGAEGFSYVRVEFRREGGLIPPPPDGSKSGIIDGTVDGSSHQVSAYSTPMTHRSASFPGTIYGGCSAPMEAGWPRRNSMRWMRSATVSPASG